MSYSNRIRVQEIEPIYYADNNRAEFRFSPNKIYTTDILLANLGLTQATSSQYNKLAGSSAMMDNLILMDGNTVLQTVRNVGRHVSWKMLRKSNANLRAVQPLVTGNESGYMFDGVDTNVVGNRNTGKIIKRHNMPDGDEQRTTMPDGSKQSKTHIPCNTILSILDEMPYLDTSVYKDLKIVVEYELSNATQSRQSESLTTQRPKLIVQEMVDGESLMGKSGDVLFEASELDRFVLPSITPTSNILNAGVQSVSFHLNGYSNKKLGKCVMFKECRLDSVRKTNADGGTDYENGGFDSHGLYKELTQVRVNGINVFAKSGINKDNKRLARCVDAWGSGGLPTFGNGLAFKAPDTEQRDKIFFGNESFGFCDHFGIDLGGTSVQDFQVDFSRTGVYCLSAADNANDAAQTALSKYNASYNLIFMANVKKAIVMDGKGSYNVRYL